MNRPDIVEVIGARIDLRRAGREWRGLCPLHNDRSPSLRVNAEKQVWYCDPCVQGGDVIDFVMLADGLTFPQACKALGIHTNDRPRRPMLTVRRIRAAQVAAAWVNEQRQKLNLLIAERYEQRDLADRAGVFDLADIYDREIFMLRGFYASLEHPRAAAEMLAAKSSIEKITDGLEEEA